MNENVLQKAKRLRLLFRSLFALFAFFLPGLIISLKYKLITEFTGYKLSVVAIVLLIILVWRFKEKLLEWIKSWEYSIMKYILLGLSKVAVFILALTILLLARTGLENLIFCIEWICLCECIAYLVIYPFEEKFDNQVKRILRGIERKSDYKEAINELGGI